MAEKLVYTITEKDVHNYNENKTGVPAFAIWCEIGPIRSEHIGRRIYSFTVKEPGGYHTEYRVETAFEYQQRIKDSTFTGQ